MTETELLFTEILNCDRISLCLNKDLLLDQGKSSLVSSILKRRISGEPIQYILGKTEFMGLRFMLDKDVFIPRPETEILVETVIKYVHGPQCPSVHSQNILDIGTGSGCIAISLAKFLPKLKIIASDISDKAIEIARYNAMLNNVVDRVKFIQSDLFLAFSFQPSAFDLIVSNPPYIPSAEIKNLQPEIRFEPVIALNGGSDGLDFYGRIIGKSPRYLKEGGFLIMEMGFNQKGAIKNIFQEDGNFKIIEVVKDYNNIDRVVVAKKRKTQSAKRKVKV